jgi:hypothetical protein
MSLAEQIQKISNAVVPDQAIQTESTVTFPGWGKVVTIFVLGLSLIAVFIGIVVIVVRQNKQP